MAEQISQLIKEEHRSPTDSIWSVFDHIVGPYRLILIGYKPPLWSVDDIPLDDLKKDVENQLTLLLAGEEYLKKQKHLIRGPKYGDVLNNLHEITVFRDSNRERFMTELENKMRELYRDETIVIRTERS